MSKLKVVALCVGLGCFTSAQAVNSVDGNFVGFAADMGVGLTHTKLKDKIDGNSHSKSKNKAAFQVGAEYSAPIYWDDFITGVGIDYVVNDLKTDSNNFTFGGTEYSVDSKIKSHLSVYVTPGYRVLPDVLVYVKLAYHYAKLDSKDSALGMSDSTKHNGFGYGIGAMYAITPNIETGLEFQQVTFNKKSKDNISYKPTLSEFTALLKYRF